MKLFKALIARMEERKRLRIKEAQRNSYTIRCVKEQYDKRIDVWYNPQVCTAEQFDSHKVKVDETLLVRYAVWTRYEDRTPEYAKVLLNAAKEAQDKEVSLHVRMGVAGWSSLPLADMLELAHDDEYVRRSVVSNPSIPEALVTELAKDPSAHVRYRIAFHHASSLTPTQVSSLMMDEDPDVRAAMVLSQRVD